jgi:hypothetical protein
MISAWESTGYAVDARTCAKPGHDGWCELRIRLHDHSPRDAVLDELDGLLLAMTDDERRVLAESLRQDPPDSGPA